MDFVNNIFLINIENQTRLDFLHKKNDLSLEKPKDDAKNYVAPDTKNYY